MTQELYETWQEHKDRPAWVQANRDAIMAATDKDIPRGRAEIAEWLDSHKGAVTQALEPNDGDTEDDN